MSATQKEKSVLLKSLLNVLLNIDGSTTLALETMTKSKLNLHMISHTMLSEEQLPSRMKEVFTGKGPFMMRRTGLMIDKEMISENIVYYDLSLFSNEFLDDLNNGEFPIGKLIKSTEYRRDILFSGWITPDQIKSHGFERRKKSPLKIYKIVKNNLCWFYIYELFNTDIIYQKVNQFCN
ncbi:chorismate pyruvate-lyase family protein [Bacillus swezeyi]|uniref:chorismate pyruvate-lyase family protein n=1 Tax=Bacillus swezeyi TaxID=1925020 RepID=UPI002E24591B|nr:chorismate pyruvate-lyase family protein [Bacillus swezeyi]